MSKVTSQSPFAGPFKQPMDCNTAHAFHILGLGSLWFNCTVKHLAEKDTRFTDLILRIHFEKLTPDLHFDEKFVIIQ